MDSEGKTKICLFIETSIAKTNLVASKVRSLDSKFDSENKKKKTQKNESLI